MRQEGEREDRGKGRGRRCRLQEGLSAPSTLRLSETISSCTALHELLYAQLYPLLSRSDGFPSNVPRSYPLPSAIIGGLAPQRTTDGDIYHLQYAES